MLGRAIWVEARRQPSPCVSARMTARSCVFYSGATASRERSHFDLPSPQARAIDTQVGAPAQISSGPVPPAIHAGQTAAKHRQVAPRRLPTATSTGGPNRSGQGP
jgi:hypothetical protein